MRRLSPAQVAVVDAYARAVGARTPRERAIVHRLVSEFYTLLDDGLLTMPAPPLRETGLPS